MTELKSNLYLTNIELSLHLGWPDKERLQKQSLLLDISFKFPQPPVACVTDQLADTYCYHSLIDIITQQVESREFRLIEHVAAFIYQSVKTIYPEIGSIKVTVRKSLGHVGLSGQAAFEYGDNN